MAILTTPAEDELDAFLAAYDVGRRLQSRGIEAGTVNTNYALELTTGRHFLRIYEQQGRDGAEREAALVAHLAAAGVPTPVPLRPRQGGPVRTLAGKPAALFPWVDGEMCCQRSVTPAIARELGAALGRVHLAGPAPGVPLGAGRFGAADLVASCDRMARSADAEARGVAGPLARAIEEVSARRRTDLPSGLVHGDLFRDNVLWGPAAGGSSSELRALLDFESAHEGPLVYDLAVTILSWAFSDAFVPSIARAIGEGYRSVRELEPCEREGFVDEAIFGALRFTVTRIADGAIRVGKRWQRFASRRQALEQLGDRAFAELVGP